jgi:N utilization substance protein A
MFQNSRSASRESGWDVDVMSQEEFEHRTTWFRLAVANLSGVDERLADRLVSEGFLSFADLSIIDPKDLCDYGHLSDDVVEQIIRQAETKAVEMYRR